MTTMNKTELEKTVTKIKKFLKQKDYAAIDTDKPGIILFSNPARKWRDFLMLRMSYDDGRTWPDARIIYPYTTAYSDITVFPDGRIGILFERDNHTKIDLAILPSWSHVSESD